MSCGIGLRHGLDLALLWLWCRLAATAPILPLDWELPYATNASLKRKRRNKKRKKYFNKEEVANQNECIIHKMKTGDYY